jgi:hypothetical protein
MKHGRIAKGIDIRSFCGVDRLLWQRWLVSKHLSISLARNGPVLYADG